MKVNDELVDRLAELAKLEFDDESRKKIEADLERIIGFIDKLNELDTENVEPLVHMTSVTNDFREDEVKTDLDKEVALNLAPLKDSDYIKVPKVLKKPE